MRSGFSDEQFIRALYWWLNKDPGYTTADHIPGARQVRTVRGTALADRSLAATKDCQYCHEE